MDSGRLEIYDKNGLESVIFGFHGLFFFFFCRRPYIAKALQASFGVHKWLANMVVARCFCYGMKREAAAKAYGR